VVLHTDKGNFNFGLETHSQVQLLALLSVSNQRAEECVQHNSIASFGSLISLSHRDNPLVWSFIVIPCRHTSSSFNLPKTKAGLYLKINYLFCKRSGKKIAFVAYW